MLIFLGAAFLYPLLYSVIYMNETIRDMPIAVVDQSNTAHSRKLIRRIDATRFASCSHLRQPRRGKRPFLQRTNTRRGVHTRRFCDKINKQQQATVSTYSDMSSFLYYRTMALGTNFAILEHGDEIKMERLNSMGKVGREAEVAASPFTYKDVILYNEGMGYGSFLIPALLILVIHQTLFFGIGMSAGTAREEDTFHQLIPANSGRSVFHVVIGKALCYFSWYMIVAVYVLGFIPKLFNQPHIGNPLDIAILIVPFLLAAIFFSMTMSLFVRNRETGFVVISFHLAYPVIPFRLIVAT